VVRGGRHNVGTHNALIAFADGSYIELIAFLNPVAGHRWYTALEKGGGLVDFCMQTDNLAADADAMRRAGVVIGMPIPMTRERPDGYRLRWILSIPEPPNTARGARMAEHIEICRRLWSEEHVTFNGKYHSFHDVTIQPQPIQQPCPIWIAANPEPREAEKPLRRVVRLADGWMSTNAFPSRFSDNWHRLSSYLKQVGKDPATYPSVAYHNININSDRNAALEESKRFLDAYYGPVFEPARVEVWTAAGTPQRCVEDLLQLQRDRAKAITLRITSWDQKGQFDRLVNEVLPKLR